MTLGFMRLALGFLRVLESLIAISGFRLVVSGMESGSSCWSLRAPRSTKTAVAYRFLPTPWGPIFGDWFPFAFIRDRDMWKRRGWKVGRAEGWRPAAGGGGEASLAASGADAMLSSTGALAGVFLLIGSLVLMTGGAKGVGGVCDKEGDANRASSLTLRRCQTTLPLMRRLEEGSSLSSSARVSQVSAKNCLHS